MSTASIVDCITIAIVVSCAALCVWAALAAREPAAKVVSVITCVTFLSSIPILYFVFRLPAQRVDYITAAGVRVIDRSGECQAARVEAWESELVQAWSEIYPRAEVESQIRGRRLVCIDSETISVLGRSVRGYNDGRTAVVGSGSASDHRKRLYLHEMSHFILERYLGYSEAAHHKAMEPLGF